MIFLKKEYRNLKKMKKCSREERRLLCNLTKFSSKTCSFAPLNEEGVPQNTNLRSAFFIINSYILIITSDNSFISSAI